jgi:hypothetical protein
LVISPRIAFSKFSCGEYGATCYLDADLKKKKIDKLVMSMEGIHKLKYASDYDCIIFDECEDNLGVFASITMKGRQVVWHYVRTTVRTAYRPVPSFYSTIQYLISRL